MSKVNSLLLASRNRTKLSLYKDVLQGIVSVVSPQEAGLQKLEVQESLHDAVLNARLKAEAYSSVAPNLFVLGEDTALEIPALQNKPGPAIRRWDGELNDDVSDEEWFVFFTRKMKQLGMRGPIPCIKKHFYHLIVPDGREFTLQITHQYDVVLRDVSPSTKFSDGPLSYLLFLPDTQVYESDLTLSEKLRRFSELRAFIQSSLDS
jgi:hypothetical protein